MRISRLAIENYRNFRRLEIDPFPASAVIVGENGVGKSNLLRAIRLVLDPDLPESARKLRQEDFCEHSPKGMPQGATVRIEVDLTDFAKYRNAESALDGCIVNLDPLTARLVYTYQPLVGTEEGRDLTRDDYVWEIVGGTDGKKDAKYLRRDIAYTVLPALRDAVGDLSRWRDSPLQELLDGRPPQRQSLETAASDISAVMDVLATSKELENISSDLSARLQNMGGNRLGIDPTLGFASSDPDKLLRSLRLFVDKTRKRSVGDTSTGNANVVYLALLLERLRLRQENESVLQPLLAVEEPEAHLHPVLQRQIFSHLLHTEPSLMVTTHSPHITAVAKLDSLVLLRSTDNDGTVAAYTSAVDFDDRTRSDLERYLDVSRSELLYCSAAIFVEGVAETYVIPEIAKALGFDLDLNGVIVASVAGMDFAPYRSLVGSKSLNVPHVIITDGDPTNKKGEYIHLGPLRAARLLEADKPEGQVAAMKELVKLGAGFDTTQCRSAATTGDIFMGPKTLEVDLVGLLHNQIVAAHNELEESQNLKDKLLAAVQSLDSNAGTHDDAVELLRRVDYVSKGRFAQRLASHVAKADFSRVRSDLSRHAIEILPSGDVVEKPIDQVLPGLVSHAPFGYIIAALERTSRLVRGHGLFHPLGNTE